MLITTLLLCTIPTVFSIIVKDPPPSPEDYKYSYDIKDPTTGDSKSQHEVRQGNLVTGAYTVVGPDGTKRTVEYTADDKHGFRAVISEEPGEAHVYPSAAYQESLQAYDINQDRGMFFTPQRYIEPQAPVHRGHFFIPNNVDY